MKPHEGAASFFCVPRREISDSFWEFPEKSFVRNDRIEVPLLRFAPLDGAFFTAKLSHRELRESPHQNAERFAAWQPCAFRFECTHLFLLEHEEWKLRSLGRQIACKEEECNHSDQQNDADHNEKCILFFGRRLAPSLRIMGPYHAMSFLSDT